MLTNRYVYVLLFPNEGRMFLMEPRPPGAPTARDQRERDYVRRQGTPATAGAGNRSFGISSGLTFGIALAGAALVLMASLFSGNAQAASSYVFQGESGNGTLGNVPTDIAVEDSTGRVFVADSENDRVVVFESSQPGAAVVTTFGEGELSAPYGIAIDPTSGDVYVSDSGNDRLVRYESDGAEPPAYTLDATYTGPAKGTGSEEIGSFASPLATDPTSGDLFVADTGNLRVERFEADGTFADSFDGADSSAGAFTSLLDIAIGPDDEIYVIANGSEGTAGGIDGSIVEEFAADGTFSEELAPGQLPNARAIGYEPRFDNLLVTTGGGCFEGRNIVVRAVNAGQIVAEYEIPTAAECSRAAGIAIPAGQVPFSILTAQTPGWGGVGAVLSVKAVMAEVNISAPSSVTASGAHLSGTVDPHGDAASAYFEYRKVGTTDWTPTSDQSVSGNGPQLIEEDLTDLRANEDFEVRLVANVSGLIETSTTETFHTVLIAPAVETGNATSITDTSAELNGTIDAIGDQTTYRFEYGLTTAYGSKAPAGAEGVAGAGVVPRAFSRPITGLQPSTTYHYRLVAKNSAGETAGSDKTFVTLAAGQPESRNYDLVTPVDKKGGVIQQLYGFQSTLDGSALVMHLVSPPGNAETNVLSNRYLTRRGPNGWSPWISPDPPQNVSHGGYVDSVTQGVSQDFHHALVVSNRALAPGAYEGGGNIYVRDLDTGSYSFVGGNPTEFAYGRMAGLQTQWMYRGGADNFDWVMLAADVPLYPGAPQSGIYRWTRDKGLELESVLPDGTPAPAADVNLFPYIYKQVEVSDDGKVLYFAVTEGETGIYRRTEGQTIPISVSEIPGDPDGPRSGRLDGVSRDGRYAFFRSDFRLTSDAPSGPHDGASLYRYGAESGDLEYLGLVASADPGRVLGVSDDGGTIFYNSGSGTEVWREGVNHEITSEHPDLGTAFGTQKFFSPSGRFFGWPSTVDASIYLYDAQTDQKVCVNCDSNGVPIGKSRLVAGVRTLSNYEPRVVTNDGSMYFDSTASLVGADHNQTYDVYRYRGGDLTLISPGDGPFDAEFSDASADGSHVFFTTDEGIVSWDLDESVDVYDSLTGTPAEPPASSPECLGDACQGPATSAPEAPGLNLPRPSGARGFGKIDGLRKLSARQRATLARGGKVIFRLSVDGSGTVSVTGKSRIAGKLRRVVTASAKARGAGQIGIPIRLSKTALDVLETRGTLVVVLSVRLGDSDPKKVSFTLRAPRGEKGARS